MNTRTLLVLAFLGCATEKPIDPVDDPRCDAPTGQFHEQQLAAGDGTEARAYWLYVPASYSCEQPAPLLVDFHGTAGLQPEEAYQTNAVIAFAEANGVIVARPRARSYMVNGYEIYQWDSHPDDLVRNATFAKNLVADLGERYAINVDRTYASGFSSGANMAAQFLYDPTSPFAGIAPIAGGSWARNTLPSLQAGPRLYLATGYRDYLWPYASGTAANAVAAGLPADRLWLRRSAGGHDLYAWHFDELWAFLDRGERPATTPLDPSWTAASLPSPADVLALARDGSDLVAAGASGRVWRHTGAWTIELDRGAPDYTTLCFGATGRGFVGGQYRAAHRVDGAWRANAMVPDYGQLGAGWVNGAACRDDGSVVVGGYWSAAMTSDAGASYTRFAIPSIYPGFDAQVAGLAQAPGGATVAVGYYDYVATAAPGAMATTPSEHAPVVAEWWNSATAIAGGEFWVVGDGGMIMRSLDGGTTWSAQPSGTRENLYAVHFADAMNGAAVGRRGTVLVTSDGGATWTNRSIGRDIFLGAVLVDAATITVAGEDGLVATTTR